MAVIAVKSAELSKGSDVRYIMLDNETGEIMDDAQGYGYKSKQRAYAAYAYKTRDKSKDKERNEQYAKIRKWMKEHREFVGAMEQFEFEIAKGSWGPEYKFNTAFVRQMLKDNELEVDFPASDLLKVYHKRR